MKPVQYDLMKLAEECGEVAHESFKAMAFGIDEKQSPRHTTNIERVQHELIDLAIAVDNLNKKHGLGLTLDLAAIDPVDLESRRTKVATYRGYSKLLGQLGFEYADGECQ